MPIDTGSRAEHGSNLSKATGFLGLEEFKAELRAIYADLSGPILRKALEAGAEVFRQAIIEATPEGKHSWSARKVMVKGIFKRTRKAHQAGTAKKSVIIYERQRGLRVFAEQAGYLIGYEKKNAYYMYWYEHGRGPGDYGRGVQPARPFLIGVYDAAKDDALKAAGAVVAEMTSRIR